MIICYQICMMALFTIKGRDLEAFVCVFMFIVSTFYIVLSYKSVNDNSQFNREEQPLPPGVFGEPDHELQKIINNWR